MDFLWRKLKVIVGLVRNEDDVYNERKVTESFGR